MNLREFKRELCSLVPPLPFGSIIARLHESLRSAGIDPGDMCCLDEVAVPPILAVVHAARVEGEIDSVIYRRVLRCLTFYTNHSLAMVAYRLTDPSAIGSSANQPEQCSSSNVPTESDPNSIDAHSLEAQPVPADPWAHRSDGMRCKTCMWFAPKIAKSSRFIHVGRCRRHAPTMNGYPVVFVNDWCGDHKLNENTVVEE